MMTSSKYRFNLRRIRETYKSRPDTVSSQPLPEVKAGKEVTGASMTVPNMRDPGQEGGRQNRQARLLMPSGNPEIFKTISLVLGTPDFQRH